MTRVLRQSVVIDSRLLTIRLRSEEDEYRFTYKKGATLPSDTHPLWLGSVIMTH